MAARQLGTSSQPHRGMVGKRIRATDSYGLVLLLIVVDYVAVSALTVSGWAQVAIVVLLGATLVFALHTSRARRIWKLLAVGYLLASTLVALAGAITPGAVGVSQRISILGGLLLLVTPVAILRQISQHQVVTSETVLGAICVYLLIGFSFAFVYTAIDFVSAVPFFVGQTQATTTANNYLFFSYTTLTTVGYGNLVPVGSFGQTCAMLEALLGQIYLVIVVARLVSLWGQERPRPTVRPPASAAAQDSQHGGGTNGAATPADAPADTAGHAERQ